MKTAYAGQAKVSPAAVRPQERVAALSDWHTEPLKVFVQGD